MGGVLLLNTKTEVKTLTPCCYMKPNSKSISFSEE